jgi:hypothetical protein
MPDPHYEGWAAGLNLEDPRDCPYPRMTKEWFQWQSFHTKAALLAIRYSRQQPKAK